MPTPPKPITNTVAPSSTFAVLSTAPTPVWMAQPITAATSKGTSGLIFTAADSATRVSSPKPATPRPRYTGWPSIENGIEPSGMVPMNMDDAAAHSVVSPRTHQ